MKVIMLIVVLSFQACLEFKSEESTGDVSKPVLLLPDNPVTEKPPVTSTKDLVIPNGADITLSYELKVVLGDSSYERYLTVCYERNVTFEENCIFKGRFFQEGDEQVIVVNNINKRLFITYVKFSSPLDKKVLEWNYRQDSPNVIDLK